MKRYSVSVAYSREPVSGSIRYHYHGRTDDLQAYILKYENMLSVWISALQRACSSSSECRFLNDYFGVMIKDSVTGNLVYFDEHISEDYGIRQVVKYVPTELGCCVRSVSFEKI